MPDVLVRQLAIRGNPSVELGQLDRSGPTYYWRVPATFVPLLDRLYVLFGLLVISMDRDLSIHCSIIASYRSFVKQVEPAPFPLRALAGTQAY